MRRRFRVAVTTGTAALVLTASAMPALASGPTPTLPGDDATSARDAPMEGNGARPGGAGFDHTVTLITGDVVRLRDLPGGRSAVSVTPPEGGQPVSYRKYTREGDLYIVPKDAARLVAGGTLDRRLFNVSALVEQGYGDTKRGSIPLIITYSGPRVMRTGHSYAGARQTATLGSVDAVATAADKDSAAAFWDSIRSSSSAGGGARTQLRQGIERVWLDARVHATLEHSTEQIHAPRAWKQGMTGEGATIAVLDTGIDATHPDLKQQIAKTKNFTKTKSVTDHFGHGTHVASIAAGTGSASSGKRKGVAFGADLLIGKVLDNDGYGQASWIIQGMEWAAKKADADVINLSLGGSPTDGTDPMSRALNELSAKTGALFVVAAGNAGQERTVGSPGSASSALTVGAVDDSGKLASFSSRGPRLKDNAIKPDITAPGVGIAAAKAKGTNLGEPAGKHYTRLSGTSMATPHVAGAAAILAARHPSWEASRLKAVLMNSARPAADPTVYEQGAGLVDVARAITGMVSAQPGSLSLGTFRYPHGDDEKVTKTLTYTNRGTEKVSLELSLRVRSDEGKAPEPGMLALSDTSLTVPPGESRKVKIRVNTKHGPVGLYGGYLTATRDMGGKDLADPAVVTRTPVGLYNEPERYDLTVTGTGRDGKPATGSVEIFGLDVPYERTPFQGFNKAGKATFRVPPGTYNVMSWIWRQDAKPMSLVGDPSVEVDSDTAVTFDARDTNRVSVRTPKPSVASSAVLGYHRASGERSWTSAFVLPGTSARHLYAAPTQRINEGRFEFFPELRMVAPKAANQAGNKRANYVYNLVLPEKHRIPDDLSYRIDQGQLARVDHRFYSDGRARRAVDWRTHGARPYENFLVSSGHEVRLPSRRTVWMSANDTLWWHGVELGVLSDRVVGSQQYNTVRSYNPGQRVRQSWLQQALHAGTFPAGQLFLVPPTRQASRRQGDTLAIWTSPGKDAEPDHHGYIVGKTRVRLYRAGTLIADRKDAAGGRFPAVAEPARYRFVLDTSHNAQRWSMSTRTHSEWVFRSRQPDGEAELLPLLNLRYEMDLDLRNRAPAGKRFTITMHASHQDRADSPPIERARLSISYDNGKTWTRVRHLRERGDGVYEATIRHPKKENTSGYVSLRARVRDADGNRLEQTLIRAYQLRAKK